MKKGPSLIIATLILGLTLTGFWSMRQAPTLPLSPMAQAAQDMLAALDEEQKDMATFPFEGVERKNWHFTPVRRKGLMWEQMTQAQHEKLRTLLRTALSEEGLNKVEEVRQLEMVLREVEGRGPYDRYRHPDRYFLSFFGEPNDETPWGWRFEGHHLSFNFSSITGKISVTPNFLGANPAEVRIGAHKGKRVLAAEEDLARTLLDMLDAKQLKKAHLDTEAPDEIFTVEDTIVTLSEFEGIKISKLTAAQQAAFLLLLRVYLDKMNPELADAYFAEIEAEGWNNTYFLWLGGKEPGDRHYYRIHNPALLIEYDNTQNGANHIHAAWRDPRNDFGTDLLKAHYENSPHHNK